MRIILSILFSMCMSSIIMADDMDSVTYYGKQIALAQQTGNQDAEREGLRNVLRLYKNIANGVSRDTIYAGLATQYGTLCAQSEQYEQAIESTT